MPVLDQAGMSGVTLGNNHILDAGTARGWTRRWGISTTPVSPAGAGMDLAQAASP